MQALIAITTLITLVVFTAAVFFVFYYAGISSGDEE